MQVCIRIYSIRDIAININRIDCHYFFRKLSILQLLYYHLRITEGHASYNQLSNKTLECACLIGVSWIK